MASTLKEQLRKEYLKKLKSLTPLTKKQWDESIYQQFVSSTHFKENKVFGLYWSLTHEVDTHKIIDFLLKSGKKVCLPKIQGKELVFYYIKSTSELVKNKWKILEPKDDSNELVNPKDIEVILVPLVAFDNKNYRIGYGGGYYDRYFTIHSSIEEKIGLGYKMQLINNKEFYNDTWDICLSFILTNF